MKVLKLIQGSEQWHEWRATGIGASESPVIKGVSPYSTPLQLWERKLGLRPKFEGNYATSRGQSLEPIVRDMYEKKTGRFVEPACIESNKYDWLLASLDGLTMEQDRIVEIKCISKEDYDNAKKGIVSEKYMPQVQHQLIAADTAKVCDFVVYNEAEDDIAIVEVKPDKEMQKEIIDNGQKFWDMIKSETAPEATDRDIIEKKDKETKKAVREYSKAKKEHNRAKTAVDEAKSRLYEIAGDNSIVCDNVQIRRYYRKGRVDYNNIPELQKIDLSEYRKDGSVGYRITELKEKDE